MERILYLVSGGDTALVRAVQTESETAGKARLPETLHCKVLSDWVCGDTGCTIQYRPAYLLHYCSRHQSCHISEDAEVQGQCGDTVSNWIDDSVM